MMSSYVLNNLERARDSLWEEACSRACFTSGIRAEDVRRIQYLLEDCIVAFKEVFGYDKENK